MNNGGTTKEDDARRFLLWKKERKVVCFTATNGTNNMHKTPLLK
jgi:hypothetical protein